MNAKILIVDDTPEILKAVERELRREGFDVVTASDPVEAAALYSEAAVVVSDWVMPNGGGARVLEESPVPVVIHSGSMALQPIGAVAILQKPASRITLRAAIEAALQPKGGEK